ncbi:MAG: hypothetical protein AAB706_01110 [Patescibacteria group bacterium]
MSYTRLLKHQDISSKVKSDPLTTALIFLGIRPYTPESVKDYQRRILEVFRELTQEKLEVELERFTFLKRMRGGVSNPHFHLLCKIGFVALACRLFFPTAYAAVMFENFQFLFYFFLLFSLATIVTWVGICKLYSLLMSLSEIQCCKIFSLQNTLQALSWQRAHYDLNMLSALGIAVPKSVELLAREIKILAPRTQCFVEYLDTDPFLFASLDGVEYYAAVWNEPRYREERMP